MLKEKKVFLNFQASDGFFFLKRPFLKKYGHTRLMTQLYEDIALQLAANTPVCHTQSLQNTWDLKSSKYGQLLKHCHFKYNERKDSEFEENFTDVRKGNILLS